MKEKQASFTAMIISYLRAYHSMHETQKIFDDFLAYDMIPNEIRALIEQNISSWKNQFNNSKHTTLSSNKKNIPMSLMQEINNAVSIARYTEDNLEKAVGKGIKQYVILGAGMDTFAFRRLELMEQLEVFEVDHPTTQELKLSRIEELEWSFPAKLHFIPIDFTKEHLVTSLTSSLFYDPKVKSFFSCIGVIPYLTQEEVFIMLRSIADIAPEGSIVVFDYINNDAFIPERLSSETQKSLEFLQNIGEPMKINGFNPSTLAKDLKSLGFRLYENLSPEDIERRYLQRRMGGHDKDGYIACAIVE